MHWRLLGRWAFHSGYGPAVGSPSTRPSPNLAATCRREKGEDHSASDANLSAMSH